MKISHLLACHALLASAVNAASIPDADAVQALSVRAPVAEILSPDNSLERRKGGGGGGGGGKGGGGGSSSGGKSGGSSGSSGGSSGRTGGTSNVGGATSRGSGPARSYGGGYYGGGAATPYAAGSRTPRGLVAGGLLLPVAALAIFPGLWLWSVYPYHLNPYSFRNQSQHNSTNQNTTLPVECLCQEYSVCGCDNNDNPTYINDLVGNGSYDGLNKSLVNVADVNGTRTLLINGTLPNGTTAPGGTDDAAAGLRVARYAGYWVMVTMVISGVAFL